MASRLPFSLGTPQAPVTRSGIEALFGTRFGLVPTTPGSGPSVTIPGWQCAILMTFGLPCTPAGVAAGIAKGISALLGGGGGGGGNGGGGGTTVQCTSGTVLNPTTGVCEFPGSPGDISTPGGPMGATTLGVFGAPAVASLVVGNINGRPIRRCPVAGLVLGLDNLCYAKGSIPRQYRKWKPDPKPPITVRDVRAIRRAESAKGRVKRLGKAVGLSVTGR